MKKRNKKYRPKRTHAPSFIYSLTLGELTEGTARGRTSIRTSTSMFCAVARGTKRTHGTSSPRFATRGF